MAKSVPIRQVASQKTLAQRFIGALRRDKVLFLFVLPTVVYFLLFHYFPMYGVLIAFKRYNVAKGVWNSPWVGMKWFNQFFGSYYFWTLLRNTLLISLYSLLFSWPMPILFALFLNEAKSAPFKKCVQTITYMPHFISTVVVVAILQVLLASDTGVITELIYKITGNKVNPFMNSSWFRPLYVGSGVWQSFGWNSIIYLAAITGIDPTLYEAAYIDGSNRWKNIWHITLPSILPTIMTLLILRLGQVMSIGYEKIILMYNEATMDVADVISSFTYRRGILNSEYSFASAIGIFNSVINFVLLITVNRLSKHFTEVGLW